MKKFSDKQKNYKEFLKEAKVKEYINKYLKELQRHFDLSDNQIRIILLKVYKEFSPTNSIKTTMKNWLDMIKSQYQDKRGKNGDKNFS